MKQGSKSESDPQKLVSHLDQLRELNPEELREQWRTLFGADPPPKLRSSLLVQGIAYRLQETIWWSQTGDSAIAGTNRR